MGSKCCKCIDEEKMRRQLENYRLNNNMYPLTISEIHPDTMECREINLSTLPGPPIFVKELADVALKIGNRLTLSVEVHNNNNPVETLKVTWLKDNANLEEDQRRRESHSQDGRMHSLDINPALQIDQGTWLCIAENNKGDKRSSCSVTIMVPTSYKAPQFLESLQAVMTDTGTVSLECKVIGTPTPKLEWWKDGRELKPGDILGLHGHSSLGTYTCVATNIMGRSTSTSELTLLQQPSKIRLLEGPQPTTRVKIGDRGEIYVKFTKVEQIKCVKWFNKGIVVPHSQRTVQQLLENSAILVLNPVEIQDEGEWQCELETKSGKKFYISETVMEVVVPRNYRRPKFLESLKAVLTEEGLVSFECKVVGYPTPELHWFKDNYELKPGDVYHLSGANSLGVYTCVAHNCMGDAESSTELTLQDIQHQLSDDERKELLKKHPPKFLQGLRSEEVSINTTDHFLRVQVNDHCAVISWLKDDVDVSNHYSLGYEGNGVHHLKLSRVEIHHQGEWKCCAKNDYGHTFSSCKMTLIIPSNFKKPKFLENLRAVLSREGTVNLECKVIGVPQPNLTWFKDNVELKAGDIHRIVSGQDGTCCLGTYTCVAKNCMGEVSSSAALLGFEGREDESSSGKLQAQRGKDQKEMPAGLVRDTSLSTIIEERTSQMYSAIDPNLSTKLEDDELREVSISLDGKEVSVSLYETPDLTENDAKQIVEMFAEQYSEHISEHNAKTLPSLRFVKESSRSGPIMMEAVVIDVSDDPFETAKSVSTYGILKEDATDVEDFSETSFDSPLAKSNKKKSKVTEPSSPYVSAEEHKSKSSLEKEIDLAIEHLNEQRELSQKNRSYWEKVFESDSAQEIFESAEGSLSGLGGSNRSSVSDKGQDEPIYATVRKKNKKKASSDSGSNDEKESAPATKEQLIKPEKMISPVEVESTQVHEADTPDRDYQEIVMDKESVGVKMAEMVLDELQDNMKNWNQMRETSFGQDENMEEEEDVLTLALQHDPYLRPGQNINASDFMKLVAAESQETLIEEPDEKHIIQEAVMTNDRITYHQISQEDFERSQETMIIDDKEKPEISNMALKTEVGDKHLGKDNLYESGEPKTDSDSVKSTATSSLKSPEKSNLSSDTQNSRINDDKTEKKTVQTSNQVKAVENKNLNIDESGMSSGKAPKKPPRKDVSGQPQVQDETKISSSEMTGEEISPLASGNGSCKIETSEALPATEHEIKIAQDTSLSGREDSFQTLKDLSEQKEECLSGEMISEATNVAKLNENKVFGPAKNNKPISQDDLALPSEEAERTEYPDPEAASIQPIQPLQRSKGKAAERNDENKIKQEKTSESKETNAEKMHEADAMTQYPEMKLHSPESCLHQSQIVDFPLESMSNLAEAKETAIIDTTDDVHPTTEKEDATQIMKQLDQNSKNKTQIEENNAKSKNLPETNLSSSPKDNEQSTTLVTANSEKTTTSTEKGDAEKNTEGKQMKAGLNQQNITPIESKNLASLEEFEKVSSKKEAKKDSLNESEFKNIMVEKLDPNDPSNIEQKAQTSQDKISTALPSDKTIDPMGRSETADKPNSVTHTSQPSETNIVNMPDEEKAAFQESQNKKVIQEYKDEICQADKTAFQPNQERAAIKIDDDKSPIQANIENTTSQTNEETSASRTGLNKSTQSANKENTVLPRDADKTNSQKDTTITFLKEDQDKIVSKPDEDINVSHSKKEIFKKNQDEIDIQTDKHNFTTQADKEKTNSETFKKQIVPETPASPTDKDKHASLKDEDKPASPKDKDKPASLKDKDKPASPKDEAEPHSPKDKDKPTSSKDKDKPASPKEKPKHAIQADKAKLDSPTDKNKPTFPTDKDKATSSTDKDKPASLKDKDKPASPADEDKPASPTDKDRPDSPKEKAKPASLNEKDKLASPKDEAKPASPTDKDKPASPTDKAKPASLNEKDKLASPKDEAKPASPTDKDKPASPTDKAKPASPTDTDRPASLKEKDKPASRTDKDKPASPKDKDKPDSPKEKAKHDPTTDRAKPDSSTEKDTSASLKDKDKPASPTDKDKPASPKDKDKPDSPKEKAKHDPTTDKAKPDSSIDKDKTKSETEEKLTVFEKDQDKTRIFFPADQEKIESSQNQGKTALEKDTENTVWPMNNENIVNLDPQKTTVDPDKAVELKSHPDKAETFTLSTKADDTAAHTDEAKENTKLDDAKAHSGQKKGDKSIPKEKSKDDEGLEKTNQLDRILEMNENDLLGPTKAGDSQGTVKSDDKDNKTSLPGNFHPQQSGDSKKQENKGGKEMEKSSVDPQNLTELKVKDNELKSSNKKADADTDDAKKTVNGDSINKEEKTAHKSNEEKVKKGQEKAQAAVIDEIKNKTASDIENKSNLEDQQEKAKMLQHEQKLEAANRQNETQSSFNRSKQAAPETTIEEKTANKQSKQQKTEKDTEKKELDKKAEVETSAKVDQAKLGKKETHKSSANEAVEPTEINSEEKLNKAKLARQLKESKQVDELCKKEETCEKSNISDSTDQTKNSDLNKVNVDTFDKETKKDALHKKVDHEPEKSETPDQSVQTKNANTASVDQSRIGSTEDEDKKHTELLNKEGSKETVAERLSLRQDDQVKQRKQLSKDKEMEMGQIREVSEKNETEKDQTNLDNLMNKNKKNNLDAEDSKCIDPNTPAEKKIPSPAEDATFEIKNDDAASMKEASEAPLENLSGKSSLKEKSKKPTQDSEVSLQIQENNKPDTMLQSNEQGQLLKKDEKLSDKMTLVNVKEVPSDSNEQVKQKTESIDTLSSRQKKQKINLLSAGDMDAKSSLQNQNDNLQPASSKATPSTVDPSKDTASENNLERKNSQITSKHKSEIESHTLSENLISLNSDNSNELSTKEETKKQKKSRNESEVAKKDSYQTQQSNDSEIIKPVVLETVVPPKEVQRKLSEEITEPTELLKRKNNQEQELIIKQKTSINKDNDSSKDTAQKEQNVTKSQPENIPDSEKSDGNKQLGVHSLSDSEEKKEDLKHSSESTDAESSETTSKNSRRNSRVKKVNKIELRKLSVESVVDTLVTGEIESSQTKEGKETSKKSSLATDETSKMKISESEADKAKLARKVSIDPEIKQDQVLDEKISNRPQVDKTGEGKKDATVKDKKTEAGSKDRDIDKDIQTKPEENTTNKTKHVNEQLKEQEKLDNSEISKKNINKKKSSSSTEEESNNKKELLDDKSSKTTPALAQSEKQPTKKQETVETTNQMTPKNVGESIKKDNEVVDSVKNGSSSKNTTQEEAMITTESKPPEDKITTKKRKSSTKSIEKATEDRKTTKEKTKQPSEKDEKAKLSAKDEKTKPAVKNEKDDSSSVKDKKSELEVNDKKTKPSERDNKSDIAVKDQQPKPFSEKNENNESAEKDEKTKASSGKGTKSELAVKDEQVKPSEKNKNTDLSGKEEIDKISSNKKEKSSSNFEMASQKTDEVISDSTTEKSQEFEEKKTPHPKQSSESKPKKESSNEESKEDSKRSSCPEDKSQQIESDKKMESKDGNDGKSVKKTLSSKKSSTKTKKKVPDTSKETEVSKEKSSGSSIATVESGAKGETLNQVNEKVTDDRRESFKIDAAKTETQGTSPTLVAENSELESIKNSAKVPDSKSSDAGTHSVPGMMEISNDNLANSKSSKSEKKDSSAAGLASKEPSTTKTDEKVESREDTSHSFTSDRTIPQIYHSHDSDSTDKEDRAPKVYRSFRDSSSPNELLARKVDVDSSFMSYDRERQKELKVEKASMKARGGSAYHKELHDMYLTSPSSRLNESSPSTLEPSYHKVGETYYETLEHRRITPSDLTSYYSDDSGISTVRKSPFMDRHSSSRGHTPSDLLSSSTRPDEYAGRHTKNDYFPYVQESRLRFDSGYEHEHFSEPPEPPPRQKKVKPAFNKAKEAEDLYAWGLYNDGPTLPKFGMAHFSMTNLTWESGHSVFYVNDETSRRRKPRFSMKLQNRVTSVRAGSYKLTCTVFGQPHPYIQWYKNGMPIFTDGQKYNISNDHGVATLNILHLCGEDTGEYSCFARNFYGKAVSSSVLNVLEEEGRRSSVCLGSTYDVPSSKEFTPVSFINIIKETYNSIENEMYLETDIRASPRPQITWTKNGVLCVSNDQSIFGRIRSQYYSTSSDLWHCRLTIERPRETDSGVYTCTAKNHSIVKDRKITHVDEACKTLAIAHETASTTRGFYMSLPFGKRTCEEGGVLEYHAPVFVRELEGIRRVRFGTQVDLTVEVAGIPQPDVRWFKHNCTYPIKEDPHFRIYKEAPGVHTLLICDLNPFDIGSYTVRISNKYGHAESTCRLIQTDHYEVSHHSRKRPEITEAGPMFIHNPPSDVYLRIGEELNIQCTVSGLPIPTVNLYRGCRNVTLQPRAYKEIIRQTDEEQTVRFTVTDLQRTDIGLYTVEIKNIVSSKTAFVNVRART